ncbi:hypothetical protein EDM68_04410 [Candidatus Uhrbacteria bacterium]|nr:MAG: hypothetical protein EDM68_04410 [Candidatus Uhrbacteria bacterium]
MTLTPRTKSVLIASVCLAVWSLAHVPAIGWFAHVPFSAAVVGDEPSPLYGALAIMRDRSPLGLRNLPQLYYGPAFAALALPAVAFDAAAQFASGRVRNAEDYRALITRDMSGMLVAARWLAVLAGFVALWGAYRLLRSPRLNPDACPWWPWLVAFGIALDPFFFKYSHLFRHWVFVVAVLVWGLVFTMRLAERHDDTRAWVGLWFVNTLGFGISFLTPLYQAMLLPLLWRWARERNRAAWTRAVAYGGALLASCALIVAWNPFPYARILRMGTESDTGHALGFGFASLASYASYLIHNHLLISILAVGLSVVGWTLARRRMRPWYWIVVWPLVVHALFFTSSETNPPRYFLPVYVLLWILAVASAAAAWPALVTRRLALPVLAAFAIALALSGAHAARWSWLASQPQPEERLIEAVRHAQSSRSVGYIGRMLPAWHDPASYLLYAVTCLPYESDASSYMASLPPLEGVIPLEVEYSCDQARLRTLLLETVDVVIEPEGESLESNTFEADWRRHWDSDRWGLRFRTLKGTLSL